MKTKPIFLSFTLLMGVSVWAQKQVEVAIYDDCSQNGQSTDVRSTTGQENGYTWVNLGLPSDIKWATCNVGTTTPEGSGNCYSWGEITPSLRGGWVNYKYSNNDYDDLTKYCCDEMYGYGHFADHKTTLDPEDDAATVNWGDPWRMPTHNEWTELLDNCTWTWTAQNGVDGYRVTSRTNGNSIFLPAAGLKGDGSDRGCYWSSTLYIEKSYCAWGIMFESTGERKNHKYGRFYSMSVRPVCP